MSAPRVELFKHQRQTDFNLPELDHDPREEMLDELDLLGFTLEPLFKLLEDPRPKGTRAGDLKNYTGSCISVTGQLVTLKATRTTKGETMYFGTFIDEEGHWIDTVHFPPMAKISSTKLGVLFPYGEGRRRV